MATGRNLPYTGAIANDGTGAALRDAFDATNTMLSEIYDAIAVARSVRVQSRTTTIKPVSPTLGDAYVIPSDATGDWASKTGKLGVYEGDSGWVYLTPAEGWQAWVADSGEVMIYRSGAWRPALTMDAAGKVGITSHASAMLAAIAGVAITASTIVGFDAAGSATLRSISPLATTLLADTTSAAMRGHLGLGATDVVQHGAVIAGHSAQVAGAGGVTAGIQAHNVNGISSTRWANDAVGTFLQVNKSRNAAIGSHTILQTGDVIGGLVAGGDDGDEFRASARIQAVVEGTPANDSVKAGWDFLTDETSRVRIGRNGRVIVGNTASVVAAGANSWLQIHHGQTGGALVSKWYNDAYGTSFTLAKSRAATPGTIGTPLQNGDVISALNIAGDDGSTLHLAGLVYAVVEGSVSAGSMPTSLVFALDSGSAQNTYLKINYNGMLGLGLTSTTGIMSNVANAIPLWAGGVETVRVLARTAIVNYTASIVLGGAQNAIQAHSSSSIFAGFTAADWKASAFGARIDAVKSRSGVAGTYGTIVQSGDTLLTIAAYGDDGSAAVSAGYQMFVVDGAPGAAVMPTRWQLYVNTGTASPSEALRVDSARTLRPGADNAQSFGSASYRWSVLYSATASIATSDAREKFWLGALSSSEISVANAIAGHLGRYQWIDAVAAKGQDVARFHVGVTAQAVEEAFATAGMDAGRYAMWTATPLTETVDETVYEEDEDGTRRSMVVSREVPVIDGSGQQRIRYGLRYDQVHGLLHAAAFARLNDLETRVAALEAA